MKRFFIIIALLLFCFGCSKRSEIHIGALLCLTGELSSYGSANKLAIEKATELINDYFTERKISRTIIIDYWDTKTSPKEALNGLQTLQRNGIQHFIGLQSSEEVAYVLEYANQNNLLLFSNESTAPSLAIENDNLFRFVPNDMCQAHAIMAIAHAQNIKTLIPLYRNDKWGQEQLKAIRALTKKYPISIAEGIHFEPHQKDYVETCTLLYNTLQYKSEKQNKENIAILFLGFDEIVPIISAMNQDPLFSSVQWIGSDGTALNKALITQPHAASFAEKTNFISSIYTPKYDNNFEEIAAYLSFHFGNEVPVYAYAAYDATWIAALSYIISEEKDFHEKKEAIHYTANKFPGITGNCDLSLSGDRLCTNYNFWIPRLSDTGYKWSYCGTYHHDNDSLFLIPQK